jgi:hypothetical protein
MSPICVPRVGATDGSRWARRPYPFLAPASCRGSRAPLGGARAPGRCARPWAVSALERSNRSRASRQSAPAAAFRAAIKRRGQQGSLSGVRRAAENDEHAALAPWGTSRPAAGQPPPALRTARASSRGGPNPQETCPAARHETAGRSERYRPSTTFFTACRRSATVGLTAPLNARLAQRGNRRGAFPEALATTVFVFDTLPGIAWRPNRHADMLTQPILDGATIGTLLAAALSPLAGMRACGRPPPASAKAGHGWRQP